MAWHAMDDHLVATREDEYYGLQQTRVGVEPESQFSVWRAVIVERFDPERPLSRLNGVLNRDAML
jgi:hypothetical protein